jgi:phage-related protein
MATFDFCPAFGATETTKPRVLMAVFGDGYQQRLADGINISIRQWGLSFSKKQANMAAIRAFLEARNGVESFDWTPPRGDAGQWLASEWQTSINNGADALNVTFTEVFGE